MSTAESAFRLGPAWPNLGRRAANILALASFGLMILAGLLAAVMVERVNSTADWVAHSLEVEGGASELLGKLQDLELAKRGFLLTRSDGFIPSYDGRGPRSRRHWPNCALSSPTAGTRQRGSTAWACRSKTS